ncbi:hypothetical protein F5880DRAFT_1511899 [Lentinula raphanica]|nr:hypothetical protein F5880DRAFT_1511899 [Lentinula raphanica]
MFVSGKISKVGRQEDILGLTNPSFPICEQTQEVDLLIPFPSFSKHEVNGHRIILIIPYDEDGEHGEEYEEGQPNSDRREAVNRDEAIIEKDVSRRQEGRSHQRKAPSQICFNEEDQRSTYRLIVSTFPSSSFFLDFGSFPYSNLKHYQLNSRKHIQRFRLNISHLALYSRHDSNATEESSSCFYLESLLPPILPLSFGGVVDHQVFEFFHSTAPSVLLSYRLTFAREEMTNMLRIVVEEGGQDEEGNKEEEFGRSESGQPRLMRLLCMQILLEITRVTTLSVILMKEARAEQRDKNQSFKLSSFHSFVSCWTPVNAILESDEQDEGRTRIKVSLKKMVSSFQQFQQDKEPQGSPAPMAVQSSEIVAPTDVDVEMLVVPPNTKGKKRSRSDEKPSKDDKDPIIEPASKMILLKTENMSVRYEAIAKQLLEAQKLNKRLARECEDLKSEKAAVQPGSSTEKHELQDMSSGPVSLTGEEVMRLTMDFTNQAQELQDTKEQLAQHERELSTLKTEINTAARQELVNALATRVMELGVAEARSLLEQREKDFEEEKQRNNKAIEELSSNLASQHATLQTTQDTLQKRTTELDLLKKEHMDSGAPAMNAEDESLKTRLNQCQDELAQCQNELAHTGRD